MADYLKPQGRFGHLFQPENQHIIRQLQVDVGRRWERLFERVGEEWAQSQSVGGVVCNGCPSQLLGEARDSWARCMSVTTLWCSTSWLS